jgi:hypothetical protein
MAVIVDLCPHCGRVTRCSVVERNSMVGGLIFGIPFVLPTSSVSCRCGNCGSDFRSQFWDHSRSVSPGEAVSLDTQSILALTNPALNEKIILAALEAEPRLSEAFALRKSLLPAGLRSGLTTALKQWDRLDEHQRERLSNRVRQCSQALQFARSMAVQHSTGAAGCLAGPLLCAGVWATWLWLQGPMDSAFGWAAFLATGAVSGGLLAQMLWGNRDRTWVNASLIPEASRAGVDAGWLLAVLQDGNAVHRVDDDLHVLRPVAPLLRTELNRSGKLADDSDVGFGTL